MNLKAQPIKALVTAAGQGQRLRPLTNDKPKPMLEFFGAPLLAHILWRLKAEIPARSLRSLGMTSFDIAVNTNYCADEIVKFHKNSPIPFYLSNEPTLMGSGGAVDHLRDSGWLKPNDHLLVHNGDIISDIDIAELMRVHFASKNRATVSVIARQPEYGPVLVKDNKLVSIGKTGDHTIALGYILSPEFIKSIPKGITNIIDTFNKFLYSEGSSIGAVLHTGVWFEIGSPKLYAKAQLEAVKSQTLFKKLKVAEILKFYGISYEYSENFFSVNKKHNVKLDCQGPVVINGKFESKESTIQLSHAVIMPFACISSDRVNRQVCYADGCIDI